MPNIDVKYSEGDKIWIPARILYAEIHDGEAFYRIAESDKPVPQRLMKERKDYELDNYD